MRDFILVFVAAIFASVLTYVIADRTVAAQAHTATVVADEEHGAVRIMIDGKDILRVDAHGIQVEGVIGATGGLRAPNVSGEPMPHAAPDGDTP